MGNSIIEHNLKSDILIPATTYSDVYDSIAIPLIDEEVDPYISEPDIYSIDTLQNLKVVIESIKTKISSPILAGRNYLERQTAQINLFERTEDEYYQPSETGRRRLNRYYTDNTVHDTFDVFDLIFPVLQPPLGTEFNNTIAFPSELYVFQVEGVQFLYNSTSALLGDEMGLGKSIQAIIAAKFLFRESSISSACILCPKAVLSDWEKKLWDWAPDFKVIKVGGTIEERDLQWRGKAHVYICTYETFRNDSERLPQILSEFDLVIFDEIQKIKRHDAEISKAARKISSKYKWGLSGTPLENKIEDLINICETLQPEIFTNVDKSDVQSIIAAYRPIFKRRKKEDVLKELPPKLTKEVWLDLLPAQRQKYNLAEQQGIVYLQNQGEQITLNHIFSLISTLKQICNYDPDTQESVKLDYLKEELEVLTEQGDKALVFSQYVTSTLDKILPELSEYNPNIYKGSLSDLQRTNLVDDFQTNDSSKVMLISLKAANAGVTLTRANYVYHFDLWWNPAIQDQAAGRVHRIGQTKPVFERLLLAENTIERRIYDILIDKRKLFDQVVNSLSDDDVLQQTMTEDELYGLFGLKKHTPVQNSHITNQASDFHSLSPREFEIYVGDLFSRMGYSTKVTKETNDGGVDIYAKLQKSSQTEHVIIQCKHKEDPRSSVDVQKIRELFGVLSADRKLTTAILVTNGRFSRGAVEFALKNGVELIDGHKLQRYVDLHYIQ